MPCGSRTPPFVMITIYAEKPDVGNKLAAALDHITLSDGTTVDFDHLPNFEKKVKSQQYKDGYLKITWNGEPCYVTWGYGHLCELKQAADYNSDYKNWRNLPIPFIPEHYEIKVKDDVKKQFELVKGLFNKSRLVINATDFDREGELIFYYLKVASGYNGPCQRAHFQSQTQEEFTKAFAHLKSAADVKNITDAGRARSIADMDIGANMTVCMSLKYPNSGVLSVGRVQTPTLNLLVERELAIRNFVPKPYFTITAKFTTATNESFDASHQKKSFEKKEEAEDVFRKINGKEGTIEKIEKQLVNRPTPNLYNQSSLQMEANNRFGFTMAKTLQLAQELYEAGLTTYPRTDSQYLTEDMRPVVTKTLGLMEKNPDYVNYIQGRPRNYENKYFDNSKVSSHFAIIPTGQLPKGLTPDQQKIYDMIARSLIILLYPSAKLEKTGILVDVSGEKFVASGTSIKEPGWMAIDAPAKEKLLPAMSQGDKLKGEYQIKSKMTEPPKKYTDSSLLAAMVSAGRDLNDEELKKIMSTDVEGIGTVATRAAIVETLVTRGYAVRNKKNIMATDKGIALIQALPLPEIKSAELTARWERRLNMIAEGKDDFDSFVRDIEALTGEWCKKIYDSTSTVSISRNGSTGLKCPTCGKEIIKFSWGYGCSGYKTGCKFSVGNTVAGKKLTDKQLTDLISKGKTTKIKGLKRKTGEEFDAALKLENGKVKFVSESKYPKKTT